MMGTLVSRVPELLRQRNWTAMDLVRRGLAYNTSYRLARGDISVTVDTARQLVEIFGLDRLDDIFVVQKNAIEERQPGA